MNIGISLFSGRQPVDVAVVAQKAEALGFDSLWVGEHPIMPVHSTSPFPGSPDGVIPASYSWFLDPSLAEAGADSAVMVLTSVPEEAALAELEQLAHNVL